MLERARFERPIRRDVTGGQSDLVIQVTQNFRDGTVAFRKAISLSFPKRLGIVSEGGRVA
jgi:hypothetical protein